MESFEIHSYVYTRLSVEQYGEMQRARALEGLDWSSILGTSSLRLPQAVL